jgi:hypothetical protein
MKEQHTELCKKITLVDFGEFSNWKGRRIH